MCTVSFLNTEEGIVITSNRDESMLRKQALKPSIIESKGKKICFPKDAEAGGTWFAMDNQDGVIVLLNGAKESHIRLKNYKKSRGLIVLELITSHDFLKTWSDLDLVQIEPFTLVMFQNSQLHEIIWDGNFKISNHLDKELPHIWSSSTLYTNELKEERIQLFHLFLRNSSVSSNALLDFHEHAEGLVINRENVVRTVSITQWIHKKNQNEMIYLDLNTHSTSKKTLKRL